MSKEIEYVKCTNKDCKISHLKRIKLTIPNPKSTPKYFCSLKCLTTHEWLKKKQFTVRGLNIDEQEAFVDFLSIIEPEDD